MDHFYITMVTFLLASCPVGSGVLTVSGSVGGQVDIRCSFGSAKTNIKYFCYRSCRYDSDVIIKTEASNNYIKKERYSIKDHGDGLINVIIKDLMKSDSGTYWCGVERVGKDTYQKVYVSVVEAPPTPADITRTSLRPPVTVTRTDVLTTDVRKGTLTTSTPTRGTMRDSNADVPVYMAAGLVVVLESHHSNRTSSNTPSTNQNSNTHDINYATATNQQPDDIYANMNYSTAAPDSLIYSAVNFPRDPPCVQYDAVKNIRDPSCVQYDTVIFTRDPTSPRSASVSFGKDSDVRNQPDNVTYSTVRGQRSNDKMVTYSTITPKGSR